MKAALCFAFLWFMPIAPATPQTSRGQQVEVNISAGVAEKLLIHKVEPKVKCAPMAARVTGTVVVFIEIGRKGEVLHPKIISGPKMLEQAALDAVRQYKYKPYLLNGTPVVVETTVSIPFALTNSC